MKEIQNIQENIENLRYSKRSRTLQLQKNQVPSTNQTKLVIPSNPQGNTFILSKPHLEIFHAPPPIKQKIQSCIQQLNQLLYKIWIKKHDCCNFNILTNYFHILKISVIIVFLLECLLGWIGLAFDTAFIIGIFILWCFIIVGIVVTLCIDFSEFNYEQEVILTVRKYLKNQNDSFLQRNRYIFKCDRDATWICVKNLITNEGETIREQ